MKNRRSTFIQLDKLKNSLPKETAQDNSTIPDWNHWNKKRRCVYFTNSMARNKCRNERTWLEYFLAFDTLDGVYRDKEMTFDVFLFVDNTELTHVYRNGAGKRLVDFPWLNVISYDKKEHPIIDNMTHKWTNIHKLWNDYETILYLDSDVKFYNPLETIFDAFETSSSRIGCMSDGFGDTEPMWEYMKFRRIPIKESRFTDLKASKFTDCLNGGQWLFKPKRFPEDFNMTDVYAQRFIDHKRWKKEVNWTKSRGGGNEDEENTINIIAHEYGEGNLFDMSWYVIVGNPWPEHRGYPVHDDANCPLKEVIIWHHTMASMYRDKFTPDAYYPSCRNKWHKDVMCRICGMSPAEKTAPTEPKDAEPKQ